MKGDLTTIEARKKPTQRMVEAARSIGVPVVYTQAQTDAEPDNGPILSRPTAGLARRGEVHHSADLGAGRSILSPHVPAKCQFRNGITAVSPIRRGLRCDA